MNRRRHTLRDERGQTMVEFALVVPILLVVLFGIFQFGALYNDYVTLTDASRVGARKAAVSRHDSCPSCAAETAVRTAASGLASSKLAVSVTGTGWEHGDSVTVEAAYPYAVNLLGVVVKSGTLKAKTTERVE